MRVRAAGFTLVEVMVALAIVAIALPALLMSVSRQIDDTGYLRDKTLAHMVAANKLAEQRIVVGATRKLVKAKDSGIAQMAGRDWYWWQEIKTTAVEKFFRIDISVALEETQRDQPLYQLSGFLSADLDEDLAAAQDANRGGNDSGKDNNSGNGNNSGGPGRVSGVPDSTRQGLNIRQRLIDAGS